MRKCIIYFLIVIEVGGGFMGIWSLLILTQWNTSRPAYVWIFPICVGFLFLFGIVAGLAFVERPQLGAALSAVYQALQIPVVSSPLLTYKLLSGVQLGVGWQEGRVVVLFEFGARSTFVLLRHTDPWGIGVNVLALVLFVYLLLQLRLKDKDVVPHEE
jgi:hypothetical protein